MADADDVPARPPVAAGGPPLDITTLLLQDDRAEAVASVVPALYQTSLFTFGSFDEMREAVEGTGSGNGRSKSYVYSRGRNPTVEAFEQKVAALEGAEEACAFSSGMGAISAALLANLRSGDRIVSVRNVYPDAYRLMTTLLPRFGITTEFVDGRDCEAVRRALAGGDAAGSRVSPARLLYLESPTTQLFELQDIAALAGIAREVGAITLLDNSWATPLNLRPLEHGVDLVMHSASKYLSGHSDVVAGVVAGSRQLVESIRSTELMLLGGKLSPFDAWLLQRGLRTLPLRMARHGETAMEVAHFLSGDDRVSRVHFPGLTSHPQHELFERYYRGPSGLLSFELADEALVRPFVDALRLFRIGVSWGGYESLVYPILLSHLTGGPDGAAQAFAIPRNLVRLHLGLEEASDLVADIRQALEVAGEGARAM